MTTITLDDELINQVMAKSPYKNANEAVKNILSDYLQQHDDDIALLFERDKKSKKNLKEALDKATALHIFDGIDGVEWQKQQRQDRMIDWKEEC